ncbi:MAG: DUF488 domain-containing protein [Candidatus Symbiobacter sp.]|nr:DUF488 domain-containing protein [Candidatus Symbiobacter sp.]
MKIFTIGFTKKNAEQFFTKLAASGATRLVDVRLNNVSQLAGFAKKTDLRYFCQAICRMEYLHLPELAPTADILTDYKKNQGDWEVYQNKFLTLMAQRKIEQIDRKIIDGGCLLCSEDTPHHCHRRLVAEYFAQKWGGVEVRHL